MYQTLENGTENLNRNPRYRSRSAAEAALIRFLGRPFSCTEENGVTTLTYWSGLVYTISENNSY